MDTKKFVMIKIIEGNQNPNNNFINCNYRQGPQINYTRNQMHTNNNTVFFSSNDRSSTSSSSDE